MSTADIQNRATRLEKLMLAGNQSKHITGKSSPLPSAEIKTKAHKLEKLLGGGHGRGNARLTPAPKLAGKPFTAVSPAVWTEIWAQTEHCVTTVALEGFAEWTTMWVLEPVNFMGGTVAAGTGSVGGAPPTLQVRLRTSGDLAPSRPEALLFCQDALEVIEKTFLEFRRMLTVPTQAWYPQFVMYMGPVAPPTPNIPGRFAAMTQIAEALLNQTLLADSLYRGALGREEVKQWSAHFGTNQKDIGRVVCDVIAARVLHGLHSVIQQAMVTNVMAMGTVVGFAPPVVMGGPVVARTIPAVGFLQGVQSAVAISMLESKNSLDGVTP